MQPTLCLRRPNPIPSQSQPTHAETVFTFRCTQKLLDRLHVTPTLAPDPSDSVLGDWYANLIRVGRTQLVLAVSERTLLPVVLEAKDSGTLVCRLADALGSMLMELGVPDEAVTAERVAMTDWVVAKTASRRVLGSLNDLAFQLKVGLAHWPQRTLMEHSLWLAKTPLKVIEYGAPDKTTVAAFATQRVLTAASSASGFRREPDASAP